MEKKRVEEVEDLLLATAADPLLNFDFALMHGRSLELKKTKH